MMRILLTPVIDIVSYLYNLAIPSNKPGPFFLPTVPKRATFFNLDLLLGIDKNIKSFTNST